MTAYPNDIIVNGATLTITPNARVRTQFPYRIYVKNGGKVIFDDCHFDGGIRIDRDAALEMKNDAVLCLPFNASLEIETGASVSIFGGTILFEEDGSSVHE